MNKHYLIGTFALLLAAAPAWAKTLTPEQALQRAQASHIKAAMPKAGTAEPRLVHTARTEAGDAAVYVFAQDAQKGYMVLGADDIAYPVLGYSQTGAVDPDNMPEQLKWWLQEYSRQIEFAAANGVTAASFAPERVEGRHAIEPMLKSHWDQGDPYNRLCPVLNGERTYTGCVATAMSQIMYYWKYPAVGRDKISYNDEEGCMKRLSWDFAAHPLEWDKKLPDYKEGQFTDEQANAVAVLMKGAGAAVKMSYAADASGALSMYTPRGFVKYFNYDPNLEYVLRSTVSNSEWDQKIYDNLVNVGPVLYGGGSMVGGGHSFVLDGYDGQGYYHFNWGWSEMSDGYYALNALNPSALGAGGGTGGGYNFTQDGVFGIQPPTGAPAKEQPQNIFQMGSLYGEVADGKLSLDLVDDGQAMWVNYTPETVKVRFGAIVEKEGPEKAEPRYVELGATAYSLKPGYGASTDLLKPVINLDSLQLADGSYKVTMATKLNEAADAKWVPVNHNYGFYNYVMVKKDAQGFSVAENQSPIYEVDSVEIVGGLYYGCLMKMRFTITNPTDHEITGGVAPLFYIPMQNGVALGYMGESMMVTLNPRETVTKELTTELFAMSQQAGAVYSDTQLYMTLFDESSYCILAEKFMDIVTMHPNPGQPVVKVNPGISIEGGLKTAYMDENTGKLVPYIQVNDPSNIHVTAGLELQKGLVAYPAFACITSAPDANGNMSIIDYKGSNCLMSTPGDKFNLDVTFDFSEAVPETNYNVLLAFGVGSSLSLVSEDKGAMLTFRVKKSAGVDDLGTDSYALSFDGRTVSAQGQDISVYNLQGILVAKGTGSVDLSTAAPGLYVARTATETLKLTVK